MSEDRALLHYIESNYTLRTALAQQFRRPRLELAVEAVPKFVNDSHHLVTIVTCPTTFVAGN